MLYMNICLTLWSIDLAILLITTIHRSASGLVVGCVCSPKFDLGIYL